MPKLNINDKRSAAGYNFIRILPPAKLIVTIRKFFVFCIPVGFVVTSASVENFDKDYG